MIIFLKFAFVGVSALLSAGCGSDGSNGKDGLNVVHASTTIEVGAQQCDGLGGEKVEFGYDLNANNSLEPEEVNSSSTIILCNRRVDGFQVAWRFSDIEIGDKVCPFGGVFNEFGYDVDDKKGLSDAEVQDSYKICHGKDGLNSRVDVKDVAFNEKGCVFGGKEILVGLDKDRNDILDESEIEQRSVICTIQTNKNLTLVEREVSPPGQICINGGVTTRVGFDLNDNGKLEDNEINSAQTECSKVQVISGVSSLVQSTPAKVSQCAYGGFIFKAGLDKDFNKILTPDEVSSNEVICNGANGLNTIVETEAYSGGNCNGTAGERIKTGLDLNGDNSLSSNEVQNQFYICDGYNGYNVEVRRTSDDGSFCGDAGGEKIQIGQDKNNDGQLNIGEVEDTFYLCNGLDGQSYKGLNSLAKTVDAGSACGNEDGIYLQTGTDDDNNDYLDDDEVVNSALVCQGENGKDGETALVNTTADTSYCDNGGVVFETGFDSIVKDGYLSQDEITNTTYVCF